jgi:uncharacterized protein (TIGR03067 family)
MCLLAFLCLLLPFDNINQEQKKELAKLQGMWRGTQIEHAGVKNSGELAERYRFAVMDNAFTFSTKYGTFSLNPAKHELDLIIQDGPERGTIERCLYEIKEDTLRLALPSRFLGEERVRPAKIDTNAETRHTVYIFQRDPSFSKEQIASYLQERKTAVAEAARKFQQRSQRLPATQEQTQQILDKLDRIEKRLEALEKQTAEKKK